jgi:hypothetical protein
VARYRKAKAAHKEYLLRTYQSVQCGARKDIKAWRLAGKEELMSAEKVVALSLA